MKIYYASRMGKVETLAKKMCIRDRFCAGACEILDEILED